MSDAGNAGDAPAGSAPGAPGSQAPSAEDLQKQVAELETDNAKLREERRTDRAKALGAEHGLSPTMTDLIAGLPTDQQEERAKALAAEMKGSAPAATPPASPGGNPAPPPAGTASPTDPPDPALEALGGSGNTPPPAPGGGEAPAAWQTAMNAEIAALAPDDFSGLREIQQRYQGISRGESALA